jgi:hypothetical protein
MKRSVFPCLLPFNIQHSTPNVEVTEPPRSGEFDPWALKAECAV